MTDGKDLIDCLESTIHNAKWANKDYTSCDVVFLNEILMLLKAQQARVMTLDLPPSEWENKVIWLEVKGEKPVPAMFKRCSDEILFGHYDRLMYFERVGYVYERGYKLRNYGIRWRCWSDRPTDVQREETPWTT